MKAGLLIPSVSLLLAHLASAQLSEPDTTFFGRVLHHGGGEPHVLTNGHLSWSVAPAAGGAPVTVRTDLTSWQNGAFSYSLRLPRHIAVSGLPGYSVPAGLPVLADTTQRYRLAEITVDGHPARLADPSALSFAADGSVRADFARVDLIVDYPLPDSDGDGLPDWWETRYGLPLQQGTNGADTDGDGLTDLAEYRAGTDPTLSGTAPRLPSGIALALPENGRAALLLRAGDSDTPAALLRYTVLTLPPEVSLVVQDGQADGKSDRPVGEGGGFTQADVDAGRVLFSAPGPLSGAVAELSLMDEVPGREPVRTTLTFSKLLSADLLAAAKLRENPGDPASLVLHYGAGSPTALTLRSPSGPSAADEALGIHAYAGNWAPRHGTDAGRLLLGSPLDDTLLGSGEADVLAAAGGANILRGYAGADRFTFTSTGTRDNVVDFTPEEGDVVDVSALLTPVPGRPLGAYLSLRPGPVLLVDADGDGSGFTDARITLTDSILPQDLDEAWDAGLIDAGGIAPRTTLFVSATAATEEGLRPGIVSFRRRGDASQSLTVPILVSGTATAGQDYVKLPASVTFPPGEKTVRFSILPLADDLREPLETVEIALSAAAAYDLGAASATVNLTDLPSRVWLEVTERAAFKDSLSPAQVLLRRSGTLGTPLTVLLQTAGRATPSVDYRRPASSLTLAAGQDVLALEILPLATASLAGGCEDVILSIKPDNAYQAGGPGRAPLARLLICERPQTLSAWRLSRQPGANPADEAFQEADADGDGFKGLMEFALNLDPNSPDTGDKTQTTLVLDASGAPGLEYRRWPAAPEIRYEIQQSTDFQNWQVLTAADSTEISAVLENDGMERVRHCLNARPPGGKVYLRLQIIRQ